VTVRARKRPSSEARVVVRAREPDPSIGALRAFAAVADAGSFSGAAALLRVRQPAVSKLVQALEADFGEALFTRHPRGVAVTPRGALLVEACARLFDELDAVGRLRHATHARAELVVGTSDHVAAYVLPEVVHALARASPEITVRIVTGAAHLVLPGLAQGNPELGVFFKLPPSRALDRVSVGRAPCQIVVRRDLRERADVLASFIGSREVDDLANKAFPTLAMLRELRPETRVVASCGSLLAHKALVARGVGVSILPRFVVDEEIARGDLSVVHAEYVYHAELEVASRRGARASRAAKLFLRELRKQLRAMGLA
jgi:DNA-binding transcriptional LysR family regulator